MNIQKWLEKAQQKLKVAGIETPELDADVLLSEVLGKNRAWLLAHPEKELRGYVVTKLQNMLERRLRHEPIAYILGRKEFYGRDIIVNSDVLVPRPESEAMIELLLDKIEDWRLEIGDNKLQIVDIGTGSGNLIISAALELSSIPYPQSSISFLGLDISEKALKVAKKNAKNLDANVEFQNFDLMKDDLSSILGLQSSILLCNLPYVPESYTVNNATKHEPEIALFSGNDGLDHYRRLFKQLESNHVRLVMTESLLSQHDHVNVLAKYTGYKLLETDGLVQLFERVTV